MQLFAWGRSECGEFRKNNEDAWLVDRDINLFVVADGMGGHLGGEVASDMAVHTLLDVLSGADDPDETRVARPGDLPDRETLMDERLRYAMNQASVQIRRLSVERADLRGMGTTVVLVWVDGTRAYVAHVGDSRAYRLRDGIVECLTRDHTVVQEEIDAGRLSPAVARTLPQRSVLTRSVGFHGRVEPGIRAIDLAVGDRLMLCSDGITDSLEDDRIGVLLGQGEGPDTVDALVQQAMAAGSEDNCTVVVIEVGA